ncbi:hypothetical protein V9T40_011605 [Parthenolecanium corni]|uniref:Carboxypeptidase n=1 Tax=Parthenolecanium corni TaxID=536013 RepID=A0AAN9T765_9HEMI
MLYLGGSSLFGLFEENGPYVVTAEGLKLREYSWTNDYNVLYIDQPVGTGFSFTNSSDGYVRSETEVADHLYEGLTQFFQLFPELRGNKFYIAGESYAGKYIPAISYKIHNLKMANQTDINLKGLFMISAYTNGLEDGYVNFCFQIGLIDSETKRKLEPIEEDIKSYIQSGSWEKAREAREYLHNSIADLSMVYQYDLTKSITSIQENYMGFIQSANIRKKIHVGNTTYDLVARNVSKALNNEKAVSVVQWIEELLEYYPIAFVGGQFDLRITYPVVVNTLKKLKWSGAFEYRSATRNVFYSGNRVSGYYKTAGNLKDVLVRGAGHMVPKDQPKATLDLFNIFVNNKLHNHHRRTLPDLFEWD